MSETKALYLKRLIDTGNLARGLTEKRGRVCPQLFCPPINHRRHDSRSGLDREGGQQLLS